MCKVTSPFGMGSRASTQSLWLAIGHLRHLPQSGHVFFASLHKAISSNAVPSLLASKKTKSIESDHLISLSLLLAVQSTNAVCLIQRRTQYWYHDPFTMQLSSSTIAKTQNLGPLIGDQA